MPIVATTNLVEARVYRMGATLVNVGEAVLEQGANRVYVMGIPDDVTQESVRVKFPKTVAQGSVRIVDALAAGLFEEEKPERERLQREIERIDQQILNREAERDLWARNADFTSGSGTTVAERVEYLSQLSDRLDGVDTRIAELRAARETLAGQLSNLHLPLVCDEGAPAGGGGAQALLLEVEARQAGPCRFEVRYRIAAASWEPLYEIHVEEVGGPVTLRLRAEVRQDSGNDWEGVRLMLSSGNALSSFSVPVLRPLFVDVHVPERAPRSGMGFGMGMAMAAAAAAPMATALEDGAAPFEEEPLLEMAAPSVQRSDQEIMSTYELSGTWDVESGGQGRIVDISSDAISADFHLTSVPCEDDGVYLAAVLHGLEDIDYYDCEASVYLEGSFMGTTLMGPDQDTGEQLVPLGKDERVHVTRKRTRHFTSTPPLLGKTKVESAYEIRVRNLRPETVTVQVHDRIPVSQNKDIDVAAGNLAGGTLEQDTGEVTWDLAVASGEEKSIALEYAVSYPKNVTVDEKLGEARSAAAALSVPKAATTRVFCPSCGSPIEGRPRFCPVCGGNL